jgi:hypothetical protein
VAGAKRKHRVIVTHGKEAFDSKHSTGQFVCQMHNGRGRPRAGHGHYMDGREDSVLFREQRPGGARYELDRHSYWDGHWNPLEHTLGAAGQSASGVANHDAKLSDHGPCLKILISGLGQTHFNGDYNIADFGAQVRQHSWSQQRMAMAREQGWNETRIRKTQQLERQAMWKLSKKITGVYVLQAQQLSQRHVYRHEAGEAYLYYFQDARRAQWIVGSAPGKDTGWMVANSDARHVQEIGEKDQFHRHMADEDDVRYQAINKEEDDDATVSRGKSDPADDAKVFRPTDAQIAGGWTLGPTGWRMPNGKTPSESGLLNAYKAGYEWDNSNSSYENEISTAAAAAATGDRRLMEAGVGTWLLAAGDTWAPVDTVKVQCSDLCPMLRLSGSWPTFFDAKFGTNLTAGRGNFHLMPTQWSFGRPTYETNNGTPHGQRRAGGDKYYLYFYESGRRQQWIIGKTVSAPACDGCFAWRSGLRRARCRSCCRRTPLARG